jgi:hypothetical protein
MVAATEVLYTLEDGTSNFTYPSAFLSTNEKVRYITEICYSQRTGRTLWKQ